MRYTAPVGEAAKSNRRLYAMNTTAYKRYDVMRNTVGQMENDEVTLKVEEKSKFAIRLFRGEVPLVITYWVFGVLVSGVGSRIAMFFLEKNYLSIATKQGGEYWILAFSFFAVALSIFILIAIWRSAGKYEGETVWSILARLVVVGNAAFLIYSSWLAFDVDHQIDQGIGLLQKNLPYMIDEQTRLDDVTTRSNIVRYKYVLPKISKSDVNVVFFNLEMGMNVVSLSCTSESIKTLLDAGRTVEHMYFDKHSQLISKFTVSGDDCP